MQTQPAKPTRRRYILLLSAIILVAAGWSGAWLYGRSVLEDQLGRQMAGLASAGMEVSCSDLEIAGYPFRYEVSCSNLETTGAFGAIGTLQRLSAVALVYNPWHVIFEARSPAALASPFSGTSGNLTFETFRASIKFSQERLDALDAVVDRPVAVVANPDAKGEVSAEKAELHVRETPDRAGALEGFLSIDALRLQSVPEIKETVDLRGHIQVSSGAALMAGANLATLVQLNDGALPFRLVLLEASSGESRAGASGDLVLNGDGTLTGQLDLTLENLDTLLQILAPVFPKEDNTLALVKGVLTGIPPSASETGNPVISLPVLIERGAVRIGFLPLGHIPPLFQAGM